MIHRRPYFPRLVFHLFFGLVFTLVGSSSAAMAPYPVKELTLVVPYPPGGASDGLARFYAERLRVKLGVNSIAIENKPGGTTALATGQVARARPDGATLLLTTTIGFATLPNLRNDLPYDPDRSFVFVGALANYLPILAVRPDLGVSNYDELIALARSQPGKLTWGSAGVVSAGHVGGEILKNINQVDMLHIPYKGSAGAAAALLGGHVDFVIDSTGLDMVKNGRAIGLATFAGIRHPQLPDVPALTEVHDGAVTLPFRGSYGIAMPAGTPAVLVEQIARATREILDEPQTQQRFQDMSLSANWMSGEDYKRVLDELRLTYKDILARIDITTTQ